MRLREAPGPIFLLVALAVLGSACRGGGRPQAGVAEDCGLPSPEADAEASRVPSEFLLGGRAELRKVHREGGLLVIALNLRIPVSEAYDLYSKALVPPTYEIVTEDYEGFEFELYLRQVDEDRLVAVQGRRPLCGEATAVFVTVDRARRHKAR